MTLHVLTCTRAEPLADRLVRDRLRDAHLRDPFEPEIVLVSGCALGRWLRTRVAEAAGVCANWRFEAPASFVWQCLRAVQPQLPARAAFEPRVTVWPLLDALARIDGDPVLAPLQAACDGDEAARHRLARAIAHAFERYLFGRVGWFEPQGFPDGAHGRWQRRLWAELVGAMPGMGARHPVPVFVEALVQAGARGARPAQLLARVSFFGTPSIAPAQLAVLGALSTVSEVYLYLLDPCGAFWLDAVDAAARERILAERPDLAMLFDDGVHPLLAAWGKSARDGLAIVADALDAWRGEDRRGEVDDDPPADGAPLLARLQHAIRAAEPAPADGPGAAPGADPSIQIHGCHGPVRQAEALHDALLGLFAALPGLAPHEVAILTPDLARHAPVIEAVFNNVPAARRIPVEVVGRSPLDDACAAALLELLRLPTGRAGAATLLEILAEPDVARMLGFDEDAAARLQAWMPASGFRAGIDAPQAGAAAPEAGGRHTLRTGLHRLMLSVALDADHDGVADLIACGDCEAGDLAALDRLAAVVAALSEVGRAARRALPVADWVDLLARTVERLVADRQAAPGADRMHAALEALREAAATPAVCPAVTLEVALAALADELVAAAPGAVPAAAVTVASIDAMRGVPFRVVCLFGLDDDAYPRARRAPDWDLMAAQPRAGDRIARLDDRGAFLDALLAARDAFVVTYAARDARTDEPRAAALPVEELREHLARAYGAGAWVDRCHPLSACSPRLFGAGAAGGAAPGDAGAGSHAAERLAAARAFATPRAARRPGAFLDDDLCRRLPPRLALAQGPHGSEVVLPLASLTDFLRQPVRHFVRQRLRADTMRRAAPAPEVDPVLPDASSARALVFTALDRWLRIEPARRDRARLVAWLARQPSLPGGAVGQAVAESVAQQACALLNHIESLGPAREPRALDLPLQAGEVRVRLVGRLDALRGAAQALRGRRPDRVDGRDLLAAWCRHLVACAAQDEAPATELIALDAVHRWEPVDEPADALGALVQAYLRMQDRPEPLAPRTAWLALQAASPTEQRKAYEGDERGFGERDGWFRRVWRDALPELDAAVEATRPLLAAAHEACQAGPGAGA